MNILDRIAALVRANLSDLLDSKSDPEDRLEEVIDEMDNDLAEAKTLLHHVRRQEMNAETQLHVRQAEVDHWEARAREALAKGNETLAREAVKRQLAGREQVQALQGDLERIYRQRKDLEGGIGPLEEKLTDARIRFRRLVIEREMANSERDFQRIAATMGQDLKQAVDELHDEVIDAECEAEAIKIVSAASLEYRAPRPEAESEEKIAREIDRLRGSIRQGGAR